MTTQAERYMQRFIRQAIDSGESAGRLLGEHLTVSWEGGTIDPEEFRLMAAECANVCDWASALAGHAQNAEELALNDERLSKARGVLAAHLDAAGGRDPDIAQRIDAINALLGEHECELILDDARSAFHSARGLGTATDLITVAREAYDDGMISDREIDEIEALTLPYFEGIGGES